MVSGVMVSPIKCCMCLANPSCLRAASTIRSLWQSPWAHLDMHTQCCATSNSHVGTAVLSGLLVCTVFTAHNSDYHTPCSGSMSMFHSCLGDTSTLCHSTLTVMPRTLAVASSKVVHYCWHRCTVYPGTLWCSVGPCVWTTCICAFEQPCQLSCYVVLRPCMCKIIESWAG